MPESFKVLIKELQALCLDIKVLNENHEEVELKEFADSDMADLEVNIEGTEESVVPQPEVSDDGYEENREVDIDDIEYDENAVIEDFDGELELDDFNDEH